MEKEKENSQSKTIIIQESDTKVPYSASWASLGYYAKKFKYWILGSTLICTILGFAVTNYIINPGNEKLELNFSYQNLPFKKSIDSSGNVSYKYLDDTPFLPSSIISKENMESVVQKSKTINQENYKEKHPNATQAEIDAIGGDYDKIDYETIVKNNYLSIQNYDSKSGDNLQYTISGLADTFGDTQTATNFLVALIQNAATQSVYNSTTNFDSYIKLYSSITGFNKFSNQISALQSEVDFLFHYYDTLTSYYDQFASITVDGQETTISKEFAEFKSSIGMAANGTDVSTSTIGLLDSYSTYYEETTSDSGEKVSTRYTITYLDATNSDGSKATKEDYVSYYQTLINSVNLRLTEVSTNISNTQEQLEKLKETIIGTGNSLPESTLNAYNAQITSLLNKISYYNALKDSLNKQIEVYQGNLNYINKGDLDSLRKEPRYNTLVNIINTSYNTLEKEASHLRDIYTVLETKPSNSSKGIQYLDTGILTTTGGIKWYLGAVGGFVLGLLVSLGVTLIIGQSERRKAYYLGEKDPIIPTKEEPVKAEVKQEASAPVKAEAVKEEPQKAEAEKEVKADDIKDEKK